MNEFKVDQIYYPIPILKLKEEYLIYELEDLYYSYDSSDNNLTINYILNIPINYLCNHIKIKSYYLNSEIKLFYSIYDDYLSKYLNDDGIYQLKKTNISYLGNDVQYFPKYVIECINDRNTSTEFKCVLLSLINCKKLKIEKRLKLYEKIFNVNINLGNILLKLIRKTDNLLIKDCVSFSSIYQIV